jgi:GNAT superfamily N-acetyltransferase
MSIVIEEKPDWISYEDIHRLIWKAHAKNRENGINVHTAEMSGDEITNYLGDEGVCFVAIEDKKLVGTLSIRYDNQNRWFFCGRIPNCTLLGILPEYQGRHVNSMLAGTVFEYVQEKEFPAIKLDVKSKNLHAIKIYRHQGFKKVCYVYKAGDRNDAITMIKWFGKCPYKEAKRILYLIASKVKVTLIRASEKNSKYDI